MPMTKGKLLMIGLGKGKGKSLPPPDDEDDDDGLEYGHDEPDGDEGPEDTSQDDDGHAVTGDLVQSGLTHEQATAIVDAIRALSGPPTDDTED